MTDPIDEIAARRAAKGIITIKIGAGDSTIVRHIKPLGDLPTNTPARRRRPKLEPPPE
jgi:hypothetical protein